MTFEDIFCGYEVPDDQFDENYVAQTLTYGRERYLESRKSMTEGNDDSPFYEAIAVPPSSSSSLAEPTSNPTSTVTLKEASKGTQTTEKTAPQGKGYFVDDRCETKATFSDNNNDEGLNFTIKLSLKSVIIIIILLLLIGLIIFFHFKYENHPKYVQLRTRIRNCIGPCGQNIAAYCSCVMTFCGKLFHAYGPQVSTPFGPL